jgi:D-alanyl-D-alanine carboxypeptidase (penicillin-binding protein 5/6)
MKKPLCTALAFLLCLTLAVPAAAVEPVPEDAISVSSPCAILMEKETGTVIYEKNAHERGAPASVTKVMTMLLIAEAVDSGLISLDSLVTASAKAASMGGSQIWLEEGEQMTVSDMLKCIAVVSANDCAVAMAEFISGSEKAFVQKMNDRAAELGCTDTHFTNCTGLFDDPDHYTTAYDLAVMSRELIRHDWIKNYTTIWMDSVRNGDFGLSNTNKLVYYYDGCTGLKTGFTSNAMYCLSATAERSGVEYIAVIMHGASIESRNEDAKALLSYGFANYTLCPLRSGEALPPVRVELGAADAVQPEYSGAGAILLNKTDAKDISYSMDLSESVPAPVRAGDPLGTLTVFSGGSVLAKVGLVAGSDVARLSVPGIFLRLLNIVTSAA